MGDIDDAFGRLLLDAADSSSLTQVDKNQIGDHLLKISKSVETLWELMDRNVLFHPGTVGVLNGIEELTAALKMMIAGAIIAKDPRSLHTALDLHRRQARGAL